MQTLRFHLWTPAFAGGAVPRKVDPFTPIRPPSIRGALRWWFRAAASAVLFPDDPSPAAQVRMLDLLRGAERELFGDTTQRSRLVVLPAHGGATVSVQADRKQWAGLHYLGYGLFEEAAPQAIVTLRDSFPPPIPTLPALSPIDLRVGLRPLGPADRITDAHRRILGATVWLWLHFGGIGARTRRGWGSLGLDADKDGLLEGMPPVQADSLQALVKGLPEGLDLATSIFRDNLAGLGVKHVNVGTAPHPGVRSIDGIATVTLVPGEHATPVDALDAAGRLFVGFRSTLERRRFGLPPLRDYHTVRTSLQTNTPAQHVDRAAFGLPLPFYFRSLMGHKTRFAPLVPEDKEADRLASPLLFRVHRIGDATRTRYVTSLVNLADRADPMSGRKVLQRSAVGPTGPVAHAPDGTILQAFIEFAIKEARRAHGGR